MACVYSIPKSIPVRLLTAVALHRKVSFHKIAVSCINQLDPPLKVYGRENFPSHGGAVLTINHYTRAGFQAWWVALAASSVIPCEVHWVQSNAWRMTGWQRPLSGVTRWLFPQVAYVLGFTSMPPIPPDPLEVEQRAQAVREVLAVVRNNPQTLVGLAPEGSDEEQYCLKMPPPGAGRFMLLLSNLGLTFLPAGFFEDNESPCIRFGRPYRLSIPEGLRAGERDQQAATIVMSAIAAQLPDELQGPFGLTR